MKMDIAPIFLFFFQGKEGILGLALGFWYFLFLTLRRRLLVLYYMIFQCYMEPTKLQGSKSEVQMLACEDVMLIM